MLTNKDAMQLSCLLAETDVFPEARQEITRTLFDYYKELLSRTAHPQMATVRRK